MNVTLTKTFAYLRARAEVLPPWSRPIAGLLILFLLLPVLLPCFLAWVLYGTAEIIIVMIWELGSGVWWVLFSHESWLFRAKRAPKPPPDPSSVYGDWNDN